MNDLIERLKKATGPDRELDALIEQTLPGVLPHPDKRMTVGYVISGDSHPRYGHAGQAYLAAPYTRSLDAAITLVPKDRGWMLAQYENGACWAEVGDDWQFQGATPAIALCIAALKARQERRALTSA